MLEATLRKYENRSVETAMVIEELIKLSKEIQESDKRSAELNISEAELAFYDAIADSESASAIMEDEELREIAAELVHAIQKNVTIDWKLRESVRAKMKIVVKRILRKHGYPPDKQERATETVLEQAEILCEEVVAA